MKKLLFSLSILALILLGCQNFDLGSRLQSSQDCSFPLDPLEPPPGVPGDSPPNTTGVCMNVELEGSWQTGTTCLENGSEDTFRNLVIVVTTEYSSGGTRDLTDVTWGGVSLTQQAEVLATNGWSTGTEVWTLGESDIQAAGGTGVGLTYTGTVDSENIACAFFSGVDQNDPVSGFTTDESGSASSVSASLIGNTGGMSILAGGFGDDLTGASIAITSSGWSTMVLEDFGSQGTQIIGQRETTDDTTTHTGTLTLTSSTRRPNMILINFNNTGDE